METARVHQRFSASPRARSRGAGVYRIGLLRIGGAPPPSFIEPLRRALSELRQF
jgi:hypothetical protein